MKHRTVSEFVRDQVVAELPPSATVREAVKVMADRHIGAVMVTETGHLSGIFTERDMVSRVAAPGKDPDRTTLAAVMTGHPQTIAADASTIDALRVMQAGGFRHLPVVHHGRLVGVLSLRDFAGTDLIEIERASDIERAVAEGGILHD